MKAYIMYMTSGTIILPFEVKLKSVKIIKVKYNYYLS
jgi:hypothetical protein